MSLILDGVAEAFAGFSSASYLDTPSMRVDASDRRPRTTHWVRSLILHTTIGDEPQVVQPGAGPAGMAAQTVRAWHYDSRHAGAHLIVDGDGSVWCLADLLREATYHAQSINEVSIGIEIAQSHGELEIWEAQLDAVLALLDALTRRLGIQRQFHAPYRLSGPVGRLRNGGGDCVGIFGHRDQTSSRGRGDPGDAVFHRLEDAGYEAFDFALDGDKAAWSKRQFALGVGTDGVPGPRTCAALAAAGRPHGLWVARPGD